MPKTITIIDRIDYHKKQKNTSKFSKGYIGFYEDTKKDRKESINDYRHSPLKPKSFETYMKGYIAAAKDLSK